MTNWLEKIKSPGDIKNIPEDQLENLAEELRQNILQVVSERGGHLAPSLGVVELTIALHRYLDLPQDKLVWDVGHQCYAHKILSGRQDVFPSLRSYGGISGFLRPTESECDPVATGHSSNSISIAAGLLQAAILRGEKRRVVAVIGDGALTGGQAYEALNYVGTSGIPLTVILNDNEMSIARNVGAISKHLQRIRSTRHYYRAKQKTTNWLKKIPYCGEPVYRLLEKTKNAFKYFVLPDVIFEKMGLVYMGPIDGHDITAISEYLRRAEGFAAPVIIHVITKKGKGYLPAERNPRIFHGVGAFNLEDGSLRAKPKDLSYTDYFAQAMLDLAAQDEKITAITAAMPDGTGLKEFAQRYPRRFFDVGIAEQHAVSFAAAQALGGLKPVVAIYSTFLQRAYDQILEDIALNKAPVVLAVDRAGLVGDDGETHQGIFDISYLRHIPGMTIMAPRDGLMLQRMLEFALSLNAPAALRYHRGIPARPLEKPECPLSLGRGELLRDGSDIGILAVGDMVNLAMQVAAALSEYGLSVAVADLRFIKPLDKELLQNWAKRFSLLAVVEENVLTCGVGSACLEFWAGLDSHPAVELFALPDNFIPQGQVGQLLDDCGLSCEKIVRRLLLAARRLDIAEGLTKEKING